MVRLLLRAEQSSLCLELQCRYAVSQDDISVPDAEMASSKQNALSAQSIVVS
ncbi:hypothetical protein GCM10011410_00530 [Hoyosella rhizosphaerae]|uniref:Uncharacterized protein n=1 Tax=Hoyosella rhizosphaerae TaxID=1755582 RepID=A0A916X8Z1_9ACTN|nr:hypothetical protein GCM10011410_00530 [Hoyosella rhizosphaerae]